MGDVQIKKIKLKDLKDYAKSNEFKSFQHLPISPYRIESYISNPRKNDEQYVLYLALKGSDLVGYRTVLQDEIFINSTKESFGWFSGNWVDPNQRRQGISTLLFNEVVNDWQGRLMYTNYAPESKALYDKSNQFSTLLERQGIRIYFQFQIYNLLAHRISMVKKLKYLVLGLEAVVNAMLKPNFLFKKKQYGNYLKAVEIHNDLTDEIAAFINQNQNSEFNRQQVEYQWVLDYPWVREKSEQMLYEFSYTAQNLNWNFLVSRNDGKQIDGLAWVKHIDGNMKVPYFVNQNYNSKLSKAVIGWAYQNNAKLLTCFNPDFLNGIKPVLNLGLFKKKMLQKYFVMNDFKESFSPKSEEFQAQDGDGDVIFT